MEQTKMSVTKAQIKATDKYQKEKMTSIFFRVNNKTDADVLEYIKSIDNKRAYFLALIRKDMAEKGYTVQQK